MTAQAVARLTTESIRAILAMMAPEKKAELFDEIAHVGLLNLPDAWGSVVIEFRRADMTIEQLGFAYQLGDGDARGEVASYLRDVARTTHKENELPLAQTMREHIEDMIERGGWDMAAFADLDAPAAIGGGNGYHFDRKKPLHAAYLAGFQGAALSVLHAMRQHWINAEKHSGPDSELVP